MSTLVVFSKSRTIASYINVISHASIACASIDKIIFAWYEADDEVRRAISSSIIEKIIRLSDNYPNSGYKRVREIFSHNNYADQPVNRSNLSKFIEINGKISTYFDLTALPKDDLLSVLSVLLALDVKRIRFFHSYTEPKLLHMYNSSDDYEWLDVYDVVDDFLGFLERREGRWISRALGIALVISTIGSLWLWTENEISWSEFVVTYVSLSGGSFSLVWSLGYFLERVKRMMWRWTNR